MEMQVNGWACCLRCIWGRGGGRGGEGEVVGSSGHRSAVTHTALGVLQTHEGSWQAGQCW